MDSLTLSLLLALGAGSTIPLGAHLASVEHIRQRWLEDEFRHSVIAFGGGVLMAATTLVLVPEGIHELSMLWVIVSFTLGGLGFFLLDRLIAQKGGSVSQLMAMLLDFIPEAIALGAALALGKPTGILLAFLIAVQNLPEGFNAFREIKASGAHRKSTILISFWAMILIGPLCAYLGHEVLSQSPQLLGAMMLAAAAGIIYLTFKDIAPQAELEAHWAPQLGAVIGFLVGLIGHMLTL
ncbi:ZIP family metal transporter [Pararhodobacter oceanensis]|uniref:Divalent cation transporter n=1 Tax=Pararhodobacter oceanensis TaxID=2172121 RepID=A0A2T8HWH9_9RHOB|nr:divalent cation transporter [Pararhodobacter oceanensis]PVH29791.1 divalent cation transporter [Pararhodobacter oceanensis]